MKAQPLFAEVERASARRLRVRRSNRRCVCAMFSWRDAHRRRSTFSADSATLIKKKKKNRAIAAPPASGTPKSVPASHGCRRAACFAAQEAPPVCATSAAAFAHAQHAQHAELLPQAEKIHLSLPALLIRCCRQIFCLFSRWRILSIWRRWRGARPPRRRAAVCRRQRFRCLSKHMRGVYVASSRLSCRYGAKARCCHQYVNAR